ncbi:hypothetical protein KAFR_0E00590 [Kazachstania africana CBS 2517]|uniref:Nuclear pore complex protein Nup85 n=1 Tax=Kazachstania africana (strain ATCC 22294 / BCRC 22015 / CBS 2517 / CECT 1963 / NBRC 1671 / NRRL Y-8276) TaxID=1071382 RepID=H2AV13_KAZAF|nr:hypothetical protein KAFR_0E00590 [Kazachstania africana CBS 2517]CCF58213.1 hypothetical protein KAFR_0E00590 [Kazachstania africana CBS 2517]
MYQSTEELLMNPDSLGFVDDYDSKSKEDNDESMEDSSMEDILPNGEVLLRLTSSRKYQPLKSDELGKRLKFKLSPNSLQNFAYFTEDKMTDLYPFRLPKLNDSPAFINYVSKLFEIYDSMGNDRIYSVQTIGLINSTFEQNHIETVNLAMEAVVTELEVYIDSLNDTSKYSNIDKVLELEESLTILNCLKLFHFTLDYPTANNRNGTDYNIRGIFISGLINWINRSDGEPNSEYIEQIFGISTETEVFILPIFWKLVNQLLLRGLFDQAIGCIERSGFLPFLGKTCKVSSNAILDLIELLKKYPIDSDESSFREWKSLTLELAQMFSNTETSVSGELRDHIEDTLLLISGNQHKILYYSNTWYESVSGFLLYYIPTMELIDEYLQLSLQSKPLDVTNNWEQSCVDIIKGDIYSILPVLESLDTCTAAFSAAICHAKGLLENNIGSLQDVMIDDEVTIAEDLFSPKNGMASYLLSSFAFELCSLGNRAVWPVAIGLITLTPTLTTSCKKTAISELMHHYPFETNDDIEWMLSVCAKWKLPHVATSLFTKLGSSMIYEGKTIEAMTNFSKAGKFDLVKDYSWTLFEASAINGRPLDDEILNAIVTNKENDEMFLSEDIVNNLVTGAMRQTLAPYAVLYKFYQAKEREFWEEALALLVTLIEFQYLPSYYLILLMAKFLYPIYLIDNSKKVSEKTVISVIDVIEKRWDSNDDKCQNVYQAILDHSHDTNDEVLAKLLPDNLDELLILIRQKLSYKLCQEFM